MSVVIMNTVKKVIVLKAIRMPALRLIPGQNLTDAKTIKDLQPYFTSRAAKAIRENHLKIVDPDMVNAKEAKSNKAKNDKLNKAKMPSQRTLDAVLDNEKKSKKKKTEDD